jgi:hypothetical protein
MTNSVDLSHQTNVPTLADPLSNNSRRNSQQPDDIPIEADARIAEARTFWLARGRSLVNDTPKAIDDAAKQAVTIAGVVVGFYVNAIFRTDFNAQVQNWWVKFFFMLPIVVLILSIASGLGVLVPSDMHININSSEAGRIAHELVFQKKFFRFRVAFFSLIIGLLLLCVALLSYYLG